MRNLFNFIYRYRSFLLFLALETLCLVFIIRYNNFQRVRLLNSSNRVAGFIYKEFHAIEEYFMLRKMNDQLAIENANLRSHLLLLEESNKPERNSSSFNKDVHCQVISAKVINNSVNKLYNYITLDKGARDGVKPDMGVICQNGVAGVVVNVSDKFSTALSLLNNRWQINAKLAMSNHFGPLHWEGNNPYMAVLNEIPYHVNVSEEDEVVTSGFSTMFPEGILIGKVVKVEHLKGDNFQKIWILLSTDFKNLHFVDIIDNRWAEEQKELEKLTTDE